jgi:hypothetical protein
LIVLSERSGKIGKSRIGIDQRQDCGGIDRSRFDE